MRAIPLFSCVILVLTLCFFKPLSAAASRVAKIAVIQVSHSPRQVYFVLIDDNAKVIEFRVKNTDPRTWQPFQPGDETYKPLVQKIEDRISVPTDLKPGRYRLGLWMPDASQSIRMDARYAVRAANRDVPWWTNAEGGCGVNILGEIQVEQ